MQRIAHIRDFSRELVTNADSGDIPQNAAVRMDNCRADQVGKLRGIPGKALFTGGSSGPSGLTIQWFQEVVLNDVQTLVCWGLDGSSVQHFYHSTDGGINWTEITEVAFLRLDGATTSPDTSFTVKDGTDTASSVNDNYNKWWCFAQGDSAWDYVTDYDGSTLVVTSLYGIGTLADNTQIVFMRFPIWTEDRLFSSFSDHRNLVPDSSNFKPSVVQRDNAVGIYTGRKQDNLTYMDSLAANQFRNLWLGYVELSDAFGHGSLDYTGLHAEKKYLDGNNDGMVASTGVNAGSADALDADDYAVVFVPLYDGVQEADTPLYSAGLPDTLIGSGIVQTVASGEDLVVNISLDRFTSNDYALWMGSRRVRSFLLYLAQVDVTTGSLYKPTSPFVLVREIEIENGSWSGSGPYTLSVTIQGRDWAAGQKQEFEFRRGHFSRLWANADFGVQVAGREVAGSLLMYEHNDGAFVPLSARGAVDRPAYLLPTPVSSSGQNSPDATAIGSVIDMGEFGIYKLMALREFSDKLAAFGEHSLQIMAFRSDGVLAPIEQFRGVGVKGFWSAFSNGKDLFWGNQESVYLLQRSGAYVEVGFPIRASWQSLSAANRKTAIACYRPKDDSFLLHSQSGDTYIFDNQKKTWRVYKGTDTLNWISQGVDGEILATDGSDIYELFVGSPTESLSATYQKDFEFQTEIQLSQFHMSYKSTAVIVVRLYDLEKSESIPALPDILFMPQSVADMQKELATLNVQRLRVEIQKQASTDQDWLVNEYSLWGTPLEPTND